MSKQSAETARALFDRMEGRGDVLSIHIEDGAKLAALPSDMFAGILYPFFQWWVKGSTIEPSDPRDKMVFAGLKTHQIENAVKRGVSLKNWHDNALKGGRPPNGGKTKWKPNGNQVQTKRVQLEEQDEGQVEDASTSLQSCNSSPGSDNMLRDGLTPPAHVITPLSVDEAKSFLLRYAPDVSTNVVMHALNGKPSALCRKILNAEDPIGEAINTIGRDLFADEDQRDTWYETVEAACDQITDEAKLLRVLIKAWNDGKYDKAVMSPSELIIERVKQLSRALIALKVE